MPGKNTEGDELERALWRIALVVVMVRNGGGQRPGCHGDKGVYALTGFGSVRLKQEHAHTTTF